MSDLVAKARAALDGIDTQVVSAARELSQHQKQNPEWVWVQAVAKRPSMSFGRWQKNSLAAPYVRLDLVLPHLDRIEALEAEVTRLREAERTAWEPPPEAERSNGYECLGQNSYNIWRHMQWSKRNGWTVRGTFDHITPNAFAPLPEARHD